MGAVYTATDTKLGRDVALKVLPYSFIPDADCTARFTREAPDRVRALKIGITTHLKFS